MEQLPNSNGYTIVRDYLPGIAIEQFRMWAMNPNNAHRGNGSDGIYYDKHDGKRTYDVWWTTAPPKEMWLPVVLGLKKYIDVLFGSIQWGIHAVDCITTAPQSSKIYAHIDTPYRFEKYAKVDETLGVQIIIPLNAFTLENGGTAYLPGSHLENLYYKDIEDNQQHYNDRLVNEGHQFLAKAGDVLMYDGRTLHSTMPNKSNLYRSALLINALREHVLEDALLLDNNTDNLKT